MRPLCRWLIIVFAVHLEPQALQAQESTSSLTPSASTAQALEEEVDNPVPIRQGPQYVDFLSKFEFWLSLVVLAFGIFVMVIEYRLLARTHAAATDILRVYAVTVILVGSLFLITAGYSSTQISPISGLFGTVAGYLLGRAHSLGRPRSKDVPTEPGGEK
jgi:hypothetical protein